MEAVRLKLAACNNAQAMVHTLLKIDDEEQLKALLLLNNWWHERNNTREGVTRRSLSEIAVLCSRQATEIRNIVQTTAGVAPVMRPRKHWKPPLSGMLKLNVDGSFKELQKKGSWGYVIRDDAGDVIQSGYGKKEYALNALQMELVASLEGMKAASELGIQNIIMESDSSQAVTAIQQDVLRLAAVGGVVHEIKALARESFAQFQVVHVPRECNKVAHELAALGVKSPLNEPVAMAGVPYCIELYVSGDLADMVA